MEKTAEQKYVGNFDEVFPIINPSELIGHRILKHKPKNGRQEKLLNCILKGIEMQLPAFRAPCMDPSEENGEIVFKPGNKPAVGYSFDWWEETWYKFMPIKNSRSGTHLHWAALLGKQMKYLVEEQNYSVEDAWKVVSNDSRDLGHYWESKDAKHGFELTGSRKVGEHSDLANTFKILRGWNIQGFWLASGCYNSNSIYYPLATLTSPYNLNYCDGSVGWLVMDV